ncbi:MAG: KEOPS complex subunit Cgi121 [Thermoplasmata archaeon]
MMPKNLEIIGCTGKIESVEKFIQKARAFTPNYDSKDEILLQFLDADKVLGKEHILSAVEHAERAFKRKKNISETMAMEILLYAAGEPQISTALAKIGLKEGCERIAVIADIELDIEGLLAHLDLKRDDEVLEYKDFKLREFGISDVEILAVDKTKIKDLVLERVAMVDVKK